MYIDPVRSVQRHDIQASYRTDDRIVSVYCVNQTRAARLLSLSMTHFSLVDMHSDFAGSQSFYYLGRTRNLILPCRWKQQLAPKSWRLLKKPKVVTLQNAIYIKTSNLPQPHKLWLVRRNYELSWRGFVMRQIIDFLRNFNYSLPIISTPVSCTSTGFCRRRDRINRDEFT